MMNRWSTITFFDGLTSFLGRMGLIAVVMLTVHGCGKKAPPVAPLQAPLTAVTDLQAVIEEQTVTLTWQHSPGNRRAAGYLVLRAQTALTQPECPGCPLVFQKVETLRMSKSLRKQRHTLSFSQMFSRDFRYTYSVRPFHTSGGQGPDSNLVEIRGLPSDESEHEATNL